MNTTKNMDYKKVQQSELASWFSKDPAVNRDKRIRETIRYPLLLKQMGLTHLDTSEMTIWELGAGPYNGVSSLLPSYLTTRFDPLKDEYAKHYPLHNYSSTKAEELDYEPADLIIATNCIDHFEHPNIFLSKLVATMKPGAFFAHLHAIDNAHSHPHKAHAWNINPEMFYEYLHEDFETCWYLDYQSDRLTYGWRRQPAFSGLYRKVTGYEKG